MVRKNTRAMRRLFVSEKGRIVFLLVSGHFMPQDSAGTAKHPYLPQTLSIRLHLFPSLGKVKRILEKFFRECFAF